MQHWAEMSSCFYPDKAGSAIFALTWTRHLPRSSASSRFNSNRVCLFSNIPPIISLDDPFSISYQPLSTTPLSTTSRIWELVSRRMAWPYLAIRLCISKFSTLTASTFSPSTLLENFPTNPIHRINLIIRHSTP